MGHVKIPVIDKQDGEPHEALLIKPVQPVFAPHKKRISECDLALRKPLESPPLAENPVEIQKLETLIQHETHDVMEKRLVYIHGEKLDLGFYQRAGLEAFRGSLENVELGPLRVEFDHVRTRQAGIRGE